MKRLLLLLSVVAVSPLACNPDSSEVFPDAAPPSCPLDGGVAHFNYLLSGTQSLATPMVSGGAKAYVGACVATSAPAIATLTSSRPEVATAIVPAGLTLPSWESLAQITSGVAGDTDLVLADGDGNELGRTTLHVADADELALDTTWGPAPGPTVSAGSINGLHVTTRLAGAVLVGDGAVHFDLSGPLTVVAPTTCPNAEGDFLCYSAGPQAGRGTIVVSTPGVEVDVPVTVTAP